MTVSLEDRIAMVDRDLKALTREFQALKQRYDARFPERSHCPKCKATVHSAAKACAACGASWGVPEDPRRGLPR